MNSTPNARGRHALWWVVGVGLAFVVVTVMALEMAQRRAFQEWRDTNTRLHEADADALGLFSSGASTYLLLLQAEEGLGDFIHGYRKSRWNGRGAFTLTLRQERSYFGSTCKALMSGGQPAEIAAVRDLFAELDIELVVEP